MKTYYYLLTVLTLLAAAFAINAVLASDSGIILDPADSAGWRTWKSSSYYGNNFTLTRVALYLPDGADFAYSVDIDAQEDEDNFNGTPDNWVSTPAMTMTEGKKYILEFQYQTMSGSKVGDFNVYLAESQVSSVATANKAKAETPVYSEKKITSSERKWTPVSVEIEGEGTRYVAFHISGDCDKRFTIGAVKVYEKEEPGVCAAAPSDLTAEAAADSGISVSLSWTLPTEAIDGTPLEGENAIEAVKIYRDENEIATLSGDEITAYTDNEETGLTAGSHSYQAAAVVGGKTGEKCAPVSVWVGPWLFEQKTMSYNSTYTPESWSGKTYGGTAILRLQDQKPTGTDYTNRLQYWVGSAQENLDAWFSSPEIELPAGKAYKITFLYSYWADRETEIGDFSVYASAQRATESAEAASGVQADGTLLFNSSAPSGTVSTSTVWNEAVYKNYTTDASRIFINFRLSGKVYKGLCISGLRIEEYTEKPFVPAAPSELTAEAADDSALLVELTWKNPTEDMEGELFGDDRSVTKVLVYRDDFDTPIATIESDVETFVDSEEYGLTPGVHSYKVKVEVDGAESEFSNEAEVIVGPVPPQELPWTPTVAGLDSETFGAFWTNYSKTYNVNWTYRPAGLFLMNNTGAGADCWLISAPLAFEEGKSYTVKYRITSTASGFTPDVQIGITDTLTPEEFVCPVQKAVIGTESECTLELPASAVETYALGEEKEYRLGIRDNTPNPEGSYNLIVTSLSVSKGTPTGIDEITETDEVSRIYDLTGKIVSPTASDKGIYIVRFKSGKTMKISK